MDVEDTDDHWSTSKCTLQANIEFHVLFSYLWHNIWYNAVKIQFPIMVEALNK